MKRLCLFDIDGTLVHVAEAEAFAIAFREHCGTDVDISYRPTVAITDLTYVADVLARFRGQPPTLEEVDALLQRFVEVLDRLTGDAALGVRTVAGATDFIAAVRAQHAVALSTGCVEGSARLKLRRAGLEHHFPCGGFSHRERDRVDIVRRAIGAAEDHYRTAFTPSAVVLFGDGPWDVTSARQAGIRFIGINEHEAGREWLRSAGAEVIFADFSNAAALHQAIASDQVGWQ